MPKNISQTKKGPGRIAPKPLDPKIIPHLPEPGHFPGAKLLRKVARHKLGKGTPR